MGVGTYRSDYGGAGASINVPGPLTEDDDYASYVADTVKAGDEPVSREDWDRWAYDSANDEMMEAVTGVARQLMFDVVRIGQFNGPSADWDRDVTLIARDDVFEIGWRSWEHDFVVAIGPGRAFAEGISRDGADAEWALGERGRAPSALGTEYAAALSDFEELLRLTLKDTGFETTYPTSGYTSAAWSHPDYDVEARKTELVESLKDSLTKLAMEPDEAMRTADAAERVEMAKAAMALAARPYSNAPQVLVATWQAAYVVPGEPEDETIRAGASLWDPHEEINGLICSASVRDPVVRAFFESLPLVDGTAAIPCTPETEEWFRSQMSGEPARIVISAAQWSEITGKPCVVCWVDDETSEADDLVLHGETEPAPGPRGP
jgi:hypothetical protein